MDMTLTEEGDLPKVSKTENCQHRIYELKRVEHFKVQLCMADDKLVDIYPLTSSAKESSHL